MVWTRPPTAPFPAVYSRFSGRPPKDGGAARRYRVQDVSDELAPRVVDFMVSDFAVNEPMCRGLNVVSDPRAVKDLNTIWVEALKQRLALVCLLENEDGSLRTDDGTPEGRPIIVGANVTTLESQTAEHKDNDVNFGSLISQLLNALDFVSKNSGIYAKYGVQEYLTAYGLSVHSDYRGENIGTEILKARVPLCKAVGLKVTGTVFTATSSQILAARCGFELLYEISYKELAEKHNMDFGYSGSEVIKYMALKTE